MPLEIGWHSSVHRRPGLGEPERMPWAWTRRPVIPDLGGQAWKMPATIDDPAILGEIRAALQTIGYAAA